MELHPFERPILIGGARLYQRDLKLAITPRCFTA